MRPHLILAVLFLAAAAFGQESGTIRIDGAVSAGALVVHGTAVSSSPDFAVLVNDVAASLDVDHAGTRDDPFRWIALVPHDAGRAKVKARFVDVRGIERASSTAHVQHAPSSDLVLRASQTSGIAPFDVSFDVSTMREDLVRYELDLDADGVFETVSATAPRDVVGHYATPGIRQVTLRAIDASGAITMDVVAISVSSFAAVNALLLRRWSAFVDDLKNGDITGALDDFSAGARPRYERALTLIQPTIGEFAKGLNTIEPMSIDGTTAHYLLTRMEEGKLRGYHVYFVRNEAGLWKIAQF